MTTAPPVLPELPEIVELPQRGSGERQRRRLARRRLAREQLIVVIVLLVALVLSLVQIVFLGAQLSPARKEQP